MIDTPQSILANRNTVTTNTVATIRFVALTLPAKSHIRLQQTETGQVSQTDNDTYRNRTDVHGAIETNAAWLGNVSED